MYTKSELGHPTSDYKGITLIALIITIILLIILAGVTINVAINGDLFGKAQTAVDKTNSKVGQLQTRVDDLMGEFDTLEQLDRSNIQVGDYINYTPDTAVDYSLTAAVSGSTSDQSIAQESLTWRVMNINDDGSVDLVSTAPTTATVYFGGALGYNNGVYVLNDLCKSQYSNSSLGITARSINLVDIENKLSVAGIAARNAYTNNQTYGNTQTYSGSYSYTPDIYTKVGTIAEEESKDYYTTPTTSTYTQRGTLNVQQTYYYFDSTLTSYFDDSTFHELIFGTETAYWLASRYANCYSAHADFGLRIVSIASLGGRHSFLSNNSTYGGTYNFDFRVRPVATLGSNIKISTEGGTADNPREISL